MLEIGERQLLNRILEALRTFATHSMVEWSPSGESLAARVAAWGEVLGEDRELIELLRNVPVERDDPARLADRRPVRLLFVGQPQSWDDPHELIRAAARRVAPGGRLLVAGDGDAQTLDVESLVRDLADLRIGMTHGSDHGSLLLARRASVRPRIALLPDSQGACLQIRTLGPLEELESRGAIELCVLPSEATAVDLADRDLLVLQRFGGLTAARLLLAARRSGLPVVVELDDDLFELPWFNPGAKGYGRFEIRLTLEALLRGADAVVTSTPYLRQRMQNYNANVHAMHNIVDTDLFVRREGPFDDAAATTFGYIGTKTHEEDFRPLLDPLKRLILEGQGRVRAVFIGHVPAELRRLPHVRYLGWFGTYHNAAHALARSGANIALAPLMDLEFNRSKSAMKYLEYGACGIPGIFSDVEAYHGFIRDRDNGLLVGAHTRAAWEAAMRFVIDHPDQRERMAEQAHHDAVANHSIQARAEDFQRLYRGIMNDAAPSFAGGGTVVPAAAPQRSSPALIVRLDRETEAALVTLGGLTSRLGLEASPIVIAADADVADLLELSGSASVVRLGNEDDAAIRNGVAPALEMTRDGWALYIDGSCKIPNDLLQRLGNHCAANVGAVGPRVLDPGSEQSAQSILGARLHVGADANDALNEYAAETPTTPVRWLDHRCVLLNLHAVAQVGGIDPGLVWEDALVDLCLRLSSSGFAVDVVNGTHVEPLSGSPRKLPRTWKTRSRQRLTTLLSKQNDVGPHAQLADPARLYGVRGERLEIRVWARPDSRYLKECLERIGRGTDLPYRLRVLHRPDDAESALLAEALDGEPLAVDPTDPQPLGGLFDDRDPATHVAFLHDGVMVTPGWLREMLSVMITREVPLVVPFSNAGGPRQRLAIDRAISLESLDEVIGTRMPKGLDRAREIDGSGGFCLLLDVEALQRRLLNSGRPDLPALTGHRGRARITHACWAYAHLLSHPWEAAELGFGAWPGGPFDVEVPTVAEIQRFDASGAAGLRMFVNRLKPLLGALKENPGNARVLAGVGLLYLVQGEIQSGMSFLDRAKKLDPFDPQVRDAETHARATLDAGAPTV